MFQVVSKKEIADRCYGLMLEWIEKSKIDAKIIYRSWVDGENGTITYEGQDHRVRCDLCIFLNIDNSIYHLFVNFKANPTNVYELNARKKALLVQRKNGLTKYDDDSKHVFRVCRADKKAIFLFVVSNISKDQINSWKSRVLCCHTDNMIPTIKHMIADMKAIEKENVKIKSVLKKK